jgi:hypothetical protein
LSFAFFSGHKFWWVGLFGIVPLATAMFGCCPVYRLFHVNSHTIEDSKKFS